MENYFFSFSMEGNVIDSLFPLYINNGNSYLTFFNIIQNHTNIHFSELYIACGCDLNKTIM